MSHPRRLAATEAAAAIATASHPLIAALFAIALVAELLRWRAPAVVQRSPSRSVADTSHRNSQRLSRQPAGRTMSRCVRCDTLLELAADGVCTACSEGPGYRQPHAPMTCRACGELAEHSPTQLCLVCLGLLLEFTPGRIHARMRLAHRGGDHAEHQLQLAVLRWLVMPWRAEK